MEQGTKVVIKILPVLYGDAISIRFLGTDEQYHNIFIDGGFASTYIRTLKKEAQGVAELDEKIGLFVVTHLDQDHIGGVLSFIKDFGESGLVDKYWFNHNLDISVGNDSNKISIADGIKLRDYLEQEGKLTQCDITNTMGTVNFSGALLTVLSPVQSDLEKYQTVWSTSEQVELERALISVGESDYSCSIAELSQKPFEEDKSLWNRVSIAFLLQVHNKSILFLADSHPSIIADALKRKGYSKRKKLQVDLVKLSHHGSKLNTSDELLSLIQYGSFAISANGDNRYYFPHKEPLARILNCPERNLAGKVRFLFNYDNDTLRRIFKEEEFKQYNFECLYPNVGENGYTIYL